jgi:NifU-like protein involved in Fe-S cluster formation
MSKKIKEKKDLRIADVISESTGESWLYSSIVKEHFFNPRNLLLKDPRPGEFDAEGQIGAPQCGDVMRMWIKVDPKTEKIKKLKWRTFGCASAIATTSIFSVMITEKGGMKIDDALKIRPQEIMQRLGGLPARKVHCSVLADKAFQATVNNYFRKTGQNSRIITEGAKVIDPTINLTEKDIETAVLEGAKSVNDLQKRLKVGIGNPEVIPEIEQLLRFYREKYYGIKS